MNDELPILNDVSDHFEDARDQSNALHVWVDVLRGAEYGTMLGGLTHVEVHGMFHPFVAGLFWPKVENLIPGDEEPVMEIVDLLSRSRYAQIREQVADNFAPAYDYLRGHDRVMDVIDRLQADADPEVGDKMRAACEALGIVRPTKPDAPSAPSDTPKPSKH